MRNLFYLIRLATRDTLRLRGSLVHTSTMIIITCLALVLLRGLTAGIVRQQEQALEKSPSSTVVTGWLTSGKGTPLSKSTEARWLQDHPEVVAVVPDIKKVVTVRDLGGRAECKNLTLLCTIPGDPLLAVHKADVLKTGDRGLVLSRSVADRLGVRYARGHNQGFIVEPGQECSVMVTRNEGEKDSTARVNVAIRAIMDFGESTFAYADRQLLDWMEDYHQGHAVPELDWPACAKKAAVTYTSYLCFTREPFEEEDLTRLAARGLKATLLEPADPASSERRTLGGLLAANQLQVYAITAGGKLFLAAKEIEDITDADDVVAPWSEPLDARLEGQPVRVVGASLHRRWLSRFVAPGQAGFAANADATQVHILDVVPAAPLGEATLVCSKGQAISVQVATPANPLALAFLVFAADPLTPQALFSLPVLQSLPPPKNVTAIVPAEFLANVHALERGEVHFDPHLRRFLPMSQENLYYQGRFYARSLHDVPTVDSLLRQAGFTTQSEITRIQEIQGYARVLGLLVQVVGGIVIVLGIWTLAAVLSDNTARKRGSLGMLRLMGVSRLGILIFVVSRALIIGIIAGVALIPLSRFCAIGSTRLGALCVLQADDLTMIFALAVSSSLLGVLYPAIQTSRLDPIQGINSGNIH